jgi:hypothetical protein
MASKKFAPWPPASGEGAAHGAQATKLVGNTSRLPQPALEANKAKSSARPIGAEPGPLAPSNPRSRALRAPPRRSPRCP